MMRMSQISGQRLVLPRAQIREREYCRVWIDLISYWLGLVSNNNLPPTPSRLRWKILEDIFLSAALDDLAFRGQGGFHSFLIAEQPSGWADAPNVHLPAADLIISHPCLAEDIIKIQIFVARLFAQLEECPLCEPHDLWEPGALSLDTTREGHDDEIWSFLDCDEKMAYTHHLHLA